MGAAVIAIGLVAAACTSSKGTSTPGSSSAISSSAASKSTGAKNITFAVAAPVVPGQVDPNVTTGFADTYFLLSTLGATLVTFPKSSPESTTMPDVSAVKPGLATSWAVAPDGITFTLGQAKSEYGNEISADDVKFAFDRSLGAKAAGVHDILGARLLAQAGVDLKNPVTVIDAKHVKINANVNSMTLQIMAVPHPAIVDSVEVKKHVTSTDTLAKDWLANHSASFGPYKVDNFTAAQTLTFVTNPGYQPVPAITKLIVRAVPSSSSRLQLLQSGEVDMATQLALTDFVAVKDKPGFTTPTVPSGTQINLDMTENHKPLDNVKVRQAISLAIDREALVKGLWKGVGKVPTGWYSQYVATTDPPAAPLTRDVTKAKALLAEAGFPAGGIKLSIAPDVSGLAGPDQTDLLVQLQSQLAEAGIQLQLVTGQTPAQNLDGLINGKFDLYVSLATAFFPSNLNLAANALASTSGLASLFNFKHPEFDPLIAQATKTDPGSAQDKILAQVNDLAAQLVPWTPLVDNMNYAAFKGTVTGYGPTSLDIPHFQELGR